MIPNVRIYYIKTNIQVLHKSIGECTILQEFVNSELYNSILSVYKINIVFKISGRYWLNNLFDLSKFDTSKYNVRCVNTFKEPNDPPNDNTQIDMCVCTTLFSFNPNDSQKFRNALNFMINNIGKNCQDIEHSLYNYLKLTDNFNSIDVLGISGNVAPNRRFLSY
jgi:hypothetical protein